MRTGKENIDQYEKVFDYVNKHTGQNITDILILYYYYFGFEIQVSRLITK